jgi:23S rRNA (guanine745-N1)-methyltransferase
VNPFDPATPLGAAALGALTCPVCSLGLAPRGPELRCEQGHSASIARQGYASLLRGRHATSGDTAEMVSARADFLAAGHYAPIAAALATESVPGLTVDLGAGTGYYLAAVLDSQPTAFGIALDLSGYACRRAARAHPRAVAATADAWQPLPLRDAGADLLLNVFAPRNGPEMRRILRPGGTLLVVTPTPRHLGEVRARFGMLGIDERKADRVDAQLAGFERVRASGIEYVTAMSVADLRNEVLMGPSAHHVDPQRLDALLAEVDGSLPVTISVSLTTYRRPA